MIISTWCSDVQACHRQMAVTEKEPIPVAIHGLVLRLAQIQRQAGRGWVNWKRQSPHWALIPAVLQSSWVYCKPRKPAGYQVLYFLGVFNIRKETWIHKKKSQEVNRVYFLRKGGGIEAPGWLSRLSGRLRLRSWSHRCEFELCVGLCADSSEPEACFGFCVSLSLWPSPVHALSLSVSKINKKMLKKIK